MYLTKIGWNCVVLILCLKYLVAPNGVNAIEVVLSLVVIDADHSFPLNEHEVCSKTVQFR